MMPTLPTLEELEDALIGNKNEQLRLLRGKLEFQAESADKVIPELTSDSSYNRLSVMLCNFGPKCLGCKNADGNTLVHLTAKTCATEATAMQYIYITLGGAEDLDSLDCFRVRGKGGRRAVHFAAKNKNLAVLKWLVEKLGSKCLRVTRDDGDTAVHIAARHQRDAGFVKFIMEELGASGLHKLGCSSRHPFHCAAMNVKGNGVLKWLIREIGPDFLKTKDSKGNTPVHLAALMQDGSSLELIKASLGDEMFSLAGEDGALVAHSAALNQGSNSALAWCIKVTGPECLLAKDQLERLPIHRAAQFLGDRSMEMAVNALGQDCLTTALDGVKRTAVHYAAMNEASNSALRWIVGQLGPECLKLPDGGDVMPIHLAAWYQGVESLSFIRDCLGSEAFLCPGPSGWKMAHYAADNYNKTEQLNWIVKEIGPQCLLEPDVDGKTAAEFAGLW